MSRHFDSFKRSKTDGAGELFFVEQVEFAYTDEELN